MAASCIGLNCIQLSLKDSSKSIDAFQATGVVSKDAGCSKLSTVKVGRSIVTQHKSRSRICFIHLLTESCGQDVYTPASYSGGPGFQSRLGDRVF